MVDFRLPWSLVPLKGKYYGTEIQDNSGRIIAKIWYRGETEEEKKPSPREMEDIDTEAINDWGESWQAWFDWSHYESTLSYTMALAIVEKMNEA